MRFITPSCGIVALLTLCPARASTEVTFATGEWAPFTSKDLPQFGTASRLVAAICKEAAITPRFVFLPWPRAEAAVAAGEVLAAFPYAITEERRHSFDFSTSLFSGTNVFFYVPTNPRLRGGLPPFPSMKDFEKFRFGFVRGNFFETDFESRKMHFETTRDLSSSLKKLHAGRIDFVVEEKTVGDSQLRALFPQEEFRFTPRPDGSKTSNFLIVSRKVEGASAFLRRFNEALGRLKSSGEYQKLLARLELSE